MPRDDYGYEYGRPSIWDGSVQDKAFQLRQEEIIGTMKKTTEHIKRWESEDGTWLLDADIEARTLFVPEQFIEPQHIAEFVEAVQAARQELEETHG